MDKLCIANIRTYTPNTILITPENVIICTKFAHETTL